MLALPVHLAPGTGPVVGVVLVDTLALLAATIAVARCCGRRVAAVVAAGSLTGTWALLEQLVGNPVWNPYAALVPFGALLLVAWVVAAGRLGWWPVAILLASLTTQAHLMFAPGAVATCAVAPLAGLVARRRQRSPVRWRWSWAPVLAFGVCWVAPLWQQATTNPGNLTLLGRALTGDRGATAGWHLALGALGSVTLPDPLWLRAPNFSASHQLSAVGGSVVWAVLVLVALAAVLVWAALRARHRVLGLAVVALLADLGACWAVAGVPRSKLLTITYLQFVLWPAGLVSLFALGYPLVRLAIPWLWDRRRADRALRHRPTRPARVLEGVRAHTVHLAAVLVACSSVAVAVVSLRGAARAGQLEHGQPRQLSADATHTVAAQLGPPRRPGERINVSVDPSTGLFGAVTLLGAAYQLRIAGWTPTVGTPWSGVLSSRYHARPGDPDVWLSPTRPAPGAVALTTVTIPGDDGPQRETLWLGPRLAAHRR